MSDSGEAETAAPAKTVSLYRKVDKMVLFVNRWMLIIGLATMALIIFVTVVLRYTVAVAVPWSEEVARYLMLWTTFIGIGPVFRMGGHIAIDSLELAMPRRGAQALRLIVMVGVVAFLIFLVWTGLDYAERTEFQTTPVTNVSYTWVSASLPVGFTLALWHIAAVFLGYVKDREFDQTGEMQAAEVGGL